MDPDLARELAAVAGAAAAEVGDIGTQLAGLLSSAQLGDDDDGAAAACDGLAGQLAALRDFLQALADETELAASGVEAPLSAVAAHRLWAAMAVEAGVGVAVDADSLDHQATLPMAPSVAAAALAEHVGALGEGAEMARADLVDASSDPALPPEVRAAARYFVVNDDVWNELPPLPSMPATRHDLTKFAPANLALAAAARSRDGVADRRSLTHQLFARRVFTEDPRLAAEYLEAAQLDADGYLDDRTRLDTAGAVAWLTAAVASTSDPDAQARLLVAFASLLRARMADPPGLWQITSGLHQLLRFLDVDRIANVLYASPQPEGDAESSGPGLSVPLRGGGTLRIDYEQLVAAAREHGREHRATATARRPHRRSGDQLLGRFVSDVAGELGSDAAAAVRRYLESRCRAQSIGQPATPTITVMPTYRLHAIWLNDGDEITGDLNPLDLPIGSDLAKAFLDWSYEYDKSIRRHSQGTAGFPSEAAADEFVLNGVRLARRLATDLAGRYRVRYCDVKSGAIVDVEPDPPADRPAGGDERRTGN